MLPKRLRLIARSLPFKRCFSSALYITGDKAHNNFAVLTPHVDYNDIINQKSELIKSIQARKLQIDFDKVEKRWNFFKMIDDHREVLEATRTEIASLIAKFKQDDPEKNKGDIEKLLLHLKLVKDDLKNVKEYSYGIEEDAHLTLLALPNVLNSKTPTTNDQVVHLFLEKPESIDKSHIEIGKSLGLIEYTNPIFSFLKSEAALFEFASTNYFQSELLGAGLEQFSNADFARSVVVEGCGATHLDGSVFTLQGSEDDLNRLHLVGGGSVQSFMAYFSKHAIATSILPLKFFSLGRKYKPSNGTDLFNSSQNTVASIFVAADDEAKLDEMLNNLTQTLINAYEKLGYHFRAVYTNASNLEIGESLRVSIQMYSNYSKSYVEVAYLSTYDDYLSKRLLFTYSINKERKFLRVLAGEALNVQRFLGCAIENNYLCKKPLLNVLQEYVS